MVSIEEGRTVIADSTTVSLPVYNSFAGPAFAQAHKLAPAEPIPEGPPLIKKKRRQPIALPETTLTAL